MLRCILCIFLLIFLLLLSGCGPQIIKSGWLAIYLDSPPDGALFPLGSEIPIVAHTLLSAEQMVLLINDEEFTALETEQVAEGGLVRARYSWRPPSPGDYTIALKFCDQNCFVSNKARIRVIAPEVRTPTPYPLTMATPTPTFTPRPTPSPTLRPTPTFTPRPIPSPTPTFTPMPPAQVNFWADRTVIVRGECTTLHWDVEYATAVYLNGEGVVGHDSRTVCPQSTTTFTLRVVTPGGDIYRNITITVQEPPPSDTTGPSIPYVRRSANEIMWPSGCPASRLTISAPVQDPSGVSGVKLIYRVKEGGRIGVWQSIGMRMVGTDYWSVTIEAKDLELSLNPPLSSSSSEGTLEIYLLAYDNLGNKTQTDIVIFKVLYCVW